LRLAGPDRHAGRAAAVLVVRPTDPCPLEVAVIAAGDRRVVVGGFDSRIMGFDLEMMVTPAPAPAEDLTRLAEVVAGRRIMTQGLVVPINSAEWTDRWNELQRTGWPRQSLLP